jgi:hypothetical protein
MKGKYLRKLGGFALAAIMLAGIVFVSPSTAEAQGRRVIIRRPYSYRLYRPFGYDIWGYDRWGYDRWGFDRFGRDRWGNYRYDPRSPYFAYRQYVFENSEKAVSQGYKDGFKTVKDDGKKAKSYKPERSHFYKEAGFGNYAEVYRSGFSRGYKDGYSMGMDDRAGK